MRWGLTRTVDPTVEPVSLDTAKRHCRIVTDDENDRVSSWIRVARETAEQQLGRALYTQTWVLTLQDWADVIWLPMAVPAQSVSTVKYYDSDGTQQTLSSAAYVLDSQQEPALLLRAPNQTWPTLQSDRATARIEITYVAGFNAIAKVPEPIVQGMLLLIGDMSEHREASIDGAAPSVLPFGVASLWGPYTRTWPDPPVECLA